MHPSIRPSVQEESSWHTRSEKLVPSVARPLSTREDGGRTVGQQTNGTRKNPTRKHHIALATIDDGTPDDLPHTTGTNGVQMAQISALNTREGPTRVAPPEVASRITDQSIVENTRCQVFEVVLQQNERTICPSCARSPRRAALPAHARGCFGLS